MKNWIWRFLALILFVGIAVFPPHPAHAQRQLVPGKELIQWARAAQESNIFSGFVLGVHDAFNEIMFCTSREHEREQIETAVTSFLHAHSDMAYKSAADLVRQALKETFPCGR
ncbi:MAG: hypothetical protein GTO41_16075 [Burkholderiales bacterium]|nr:hypothetical protein [Burkholderiales bacterium]